MNVILVHFLNILVLGAVAYEPTWDSLDSRKIPEWYHNVKIGIMLQFAEESVQESFDLSGWIDVFDASGAKYLILPASYVSANHPEVIRNRTDLHLGIYYPLSAGGEPVYAENSSELMQLVEKYEPSIIWADDGLEANDTYWQSTEFLSWLYNESPVKDTVVVNDRWGNDTRCRHGDFNTCQYDKCDIHLFLGQKWERKISLDKYPSNNGTEDYITMQQLINETVETIGCGGNIVFNVTVTSNGTVDPIAIRQLLELGQWLQINGEAFYNARQLSIDLVSIWGTTCEVKIAYIMFLTWPEKDALISGAGGYLLGYYSILTLLGSEGRVTFRQDHEDTHFYLPPRAEVPTQYGWIIRIDNTN